MVRSVSRSGCSSSPGSAVVCSSSGAGAISSSRNCSRLRQYLRPSGRGGEDGGEARALPFPALYADVPVVQFDEALHYGQPDARAGVVGVGGVELFEDVLYVLHGDARPRVADAEVYVVAFAGEADADCAVLRREAEGVGKQVEVDALHLVAVGHHPEVFFPGARIEPETDVLLQGQRAEGLAPFFYVRPQVDGGQVQFELPGFVFAEVEYLVDQALQDERVLVYELEQGALSGRERGFEQLLYRGEYQGERCAEIVGYVGEEGQLRVGCFLHLFGQVDQAVPLFLKLFFLEEELFVHPVLLPVGTGYEEKQGGQQEQYGQAGREQELLRGGTREVAADELVEVLDFVVLLVDVFGLELHDAHVA